MKTGLLIFMALMLLCTARLFSYCNSAWTSMSGAHTLTVNPVIYDLQSRERSTDLMVGYGFTDNFEVFSTLANLSFSPLAKYNDSWVMGRFALKPNHIFAAEFEDGPDGWFLSPQYHFFTESDRMAWEFNVVPVFSSKGVDGSSLSICFSPVYKLMPDVLYPFLEIDPSIGFDGATGLAVAPGLWFAIPGTSQQITLSAPISKNEKGAVRLGLNFWWSWSLCLGKANDK
jgi:hypothetical protein